jgi:hypothetical protein
MMRARKIWRKSTGPKTTAGKARAAQNALKHGKYTSHRRALMDALRAQQRYIRAVNAYAADRVFHTTGSTFMKRQRRKLEKQGRAVLNQLSNALMAQENFHDKKFRQNELLECPMWGPKSVGLVHQH